MSCRSIFVGIKIRRSHCRADGMKARVTRISLTTEQHGCFVRGRFLHVYIDIVKPSLQDFVGRREMRLQIREVGERFESC